MTGNSKRKQAVPARRAIYNYPIVPEAAKRHRRAGPPVTRRDLKTDFRNALSSFSSNLWSDPIFRQMFFEARLGSVLWHGWYGAGEPAEATSDPARRGKEIPGWKTAAREYARRGLYIHGFNSMADSPISRTQHDAMRRVFGRRWLGHNQGEWDGAYIGQVAGGAIALSPKRSRKEACRHYLEWMGGNFRKHHDYMVTISSLGFGCHYDAELGSRMMGLEPGEALPSDTVAMAFCRGACRQYDLLMATTPSVFSWRGGIHSFKIYPKYGQPQAVLANEYCLAGPEYGTSLGLLKRLWWISYMSGASIIGIQFGYFPCDVTVARDGAFGHGAVALEEPLNETRFKKQLTPLGWLAYDCKERAREHPLRGVPYTPVAVLLPHDHGWHAQPTNYAKQTRNCVWGNIPYGPGDWQIDRFFQWVYPGYKQASQGTYLDERGKITNTPFGDLFDVILSNADAACLERYRVVVLLGNHDVDGDPALRKRLVDFTVAGGLVIADRGQWKNAPIGVVCLKAPFWEAGNKDASLFDRTAVTVGKYLERYQPLAIEGRPIYYLVNVTDRPDELLATLCNNSSTLPWEGTIRVKEQAIVAAEEWLAADEAAVRDGALRCGVPANDVRIFRLRARRSFLNLRFRDVPWEQLGFGAPEWPEAERVAGPNQRLRGGR